MSNKNKNLPDTSQKPDNSYFDGQVVSYSFAVDGQQATLGVIQPEFSGEFPVADGGEDISLPKDIVDAGLAIDVVDADGTLHESRVLTRKGDSISAIGGQTLRVATSGAMVEYICVNPGQPANKA